MTRNFISRLILTILSVMILSSTAFALDLTTAKSEGLVGEMQNGLIGAVNKADGIEDLIQSVNSGRMAIYSQNATEQKIPVSQVQTIAGKKLQSATPEGGYIQKSDGTWIKK